MIFTLRYTPPSLLTLSRLILLGNTTRSTSSLEHIFLPLLLLPQTLHTLTVDLGILAHGLELLQLANLLLGRLDLDGTRLGEEELEDVGRVLLCHVDGHDALISVWWGGLGHIVARGGGLGAGCGCGCGIGLAEVDGEGGLGVVGGVAVDDHRDGGVVVL